MISDLVRPMGPKSVVHQRVEHLFRKLLTGDLTKLKNVVTVENAPTLMAMVYFVNVDLLQPKFDSNVAGSIVKAAHGGTGTLCGGMFEEGQTQADLSGKLDKTAARIAKAEADKAKLAEEIKLLEEEIAEMDAGQAEATKVQQA